MEKKAYSEFIRDGIVNNTDGSCLVRDNLVIAFFRKCPFAKMVEDVNYCFDKYMELIPRDVLKWSIIGYNSGTFQPITNNSLSRCRSMLTVAIAKQKNIHFRLLGPKEYGPDYSISVTGHKSPSNEGFLDETNTIELRFPREYLNRIGKDAFVTMVKDLYDHLPCDSGYASISLCYGKEAKLQEAGAYMVPLATRSHGFDIPSNQSTGYSLGKHSRGAKWLTILSNELVKKIGGLKILKEKLVDGIEIMRSPHGILLRAGQSPEIGDTDQNHNTPLLASVAQAIEPITYFGDSSLRPFFVNNAQKQEIWERRFWQDGKEKQE